MSALLFSDYAAEYEKRIREKLSAAPRYWAYVVFNDPRPTASTVADTSDQILEFFEKHNAGGNVKTFAVHDSLRHVTEHQVFKADSYSRREFAAFMSEATVSSAALWLWRSEQRQDATLKHKETANKP